MTRRRTSPRLRGAAKREAILAAAWDVFRQAGFANASMDEVTRRAGGSKASLYAHFGSKEGLFKALVEHRSEAVAATLTSPDLDGSVEQRLTALATAMVANLTSPDVQALHRIALSSRLEGAAVGRLLYENGTRRVIETLAAVLAADMERGQLRADDPTAAAEAFLGLLLGASYIRFALGVPEKVTAVVRRERIARAVRIFLAAFR